MFELYRTTWQLLRKDLLIEIRRGELTAMVLIGVVGLSVVLSYGVWLAGLSPSERITLAPALALSVVLMTALSVIGKFSEYDHDTGGLDGLLVAQVSHDALYLSRVIAIFIVSFVIALATNLMLPTLLGLDFRTLYSAPGTAVYSAPETAVFPVPAGVVVAAAVALGLGSCGALLAPIAARLRVGSFFLLTLMLPLVIPLFFAGCEVLSGVERTRDFWWTVLATLNAIYLAAGLWLHPHVVR